MPTNDVRFPSLLLAVLAAGTLVPVVGTAGGSASAGVKPPRNHIGMRLVDAPVSERADSRAWRYIIDHLPPGAVIHRRVEVSNTTSSLQHLSLYAAGGSIRHQSFQFAPGRSPNELSTWVTPDRHEVTLAPRGTAMVRTTIAVPADAAPGERYAVIWAQAAKSAPAGGGIAEVNRVGVRVYLSVGPGNPPASAFTIDSLTAQRAPDGRPVVLAQVHNTGGRALDLSGDLRLTDGPGSLNAGPFPVQLGTTLGPGDSGPVTVRLNERLPSGPWHARIRLVSGLTRGSAEATIRFPESGSAKAVKAGTNLTDLSIVVVALCVALSAVVMIRAMRRRRTGST